MLSPEILQKIQRIYIKSRHLANDAFAGEYETAFRGRGMEFEEVREYTPGDDVRAIDWNVTARMNHPFVKVYREEREQTVMLIMDASASENFGSQKILKKDVVAEIAAVLTYAAVKSNDKVGLIMFSDRIEKYIPPKKGRAHVWHVISEILSFKPKGMETNMNEAVNFFTRVANRCSICFVISDFQTHGFERGLQIANFKHDVIAMMVHDPLELAFPRGALMTFKDLETGATQVVDLGSKRSRQLYADHQKEQLDEKIKSFRSMNIDCLSLRADLDYIEPLLKFFRMRERRI